MDAKPVADPALLLARFEGDAELLREIIELFLADCPARLANVRDAIDRRDGMGLARAAHSLKGSAANFVAYPAVAAAQRIELLGRTEDWAEIGTALVVLETEIEHLVRALREIA